MASSKFGMACLLLVLCMVVPILATDYTVGDTAGWTTGVDYSSWTKGKTFKIGDNLVFNYPPSHTVDEVSSSDYSSCTVGNSISTDSSGATTIALKTAGTHYFICGVMGHCGNGMKLAVKVESGSSSTTPSKTPSSSSASPSADTPSTTTTTPSTTTTTTSTNTSSSWSLSPFVAYWVATATTLLVMVVIS
ncbi:Plastocyanin-like protein [Corchorus olitorius]|uniref:Plastocyanin-like protein n=1 Tax=Corchorus olitorius TaxID=93759 RepID=A0A1R3K2S7_9ROSI|nr:Plastocyanin-like protein [Corchorus olitorius]